MPLSNPLLDTAVTLDRIEFVPLRAELDPPATFSWGSADQRNIGLVRVELSDGTVGWGETSVTFPLWSLEERAVTVANLAPLAVGACVASFADVAALTAALRTATDRLTLLWSPVAISGAIGAIEMATLDALTRSAGVPAWQALGGSADPVPMYAVGFAGDAHQMAEQASQRLDEGYSAVKLRVGFGLERDVELVCTAREVLGDEATIYLDANMAWTREDAADAVRALTPFRPDWLEEPLAYDDVDGLAALRAGTDIPIAAGENAYGPAALQRLLDADAVDVLMPDLARCGGFLVGLDAARTATERGVRVSPHHYASDIGFAADVALCSALGTGVLLRDVSHWPVREEITGEALQFRDAHALPYAEPGLSPLPAPDQIERHRLP